MKRNIELEKKIKYAISEYSIIKEYFFREKIDGMIIWDAIDSDNIWFNEWVERNCISNQILIDVLNFDGDNVKSKNNVTEEVDGKKVFIDSFAVDGEYLRKKYFNVKLEFSSPVSICLITDKHDYLNNRCRLREANHRVKTNLSILASLLRLKKCETFNTIDLSSFIVQIESIANLHDQMTYESYYGEINIIQYFKQYVDNIISIYKDVDLDIRTEIEDIKVSHKLAVDLCIIINEIIAIEIKSKLPNKSKLKLDIRIRLENNIIVLTYSRTDASFSSLNYNRIHDSIEMQIVNAVIDEHKGQFTMLLDDEYRLVIRIKNDKAVSHYMGL